MLPACAVVPATESWTFKTTATVSHSYILVSFHGVCSSGESLSHWGGNMEREWLASLLCCVSRGEMLFSLVLAMQSGPHGYEAIKSSTTQWPPPHPWKVTWTSVAQEDSVPLTDPALPALLSSYNNNVQHMAPKGEVSPPPWMNLTAVFVLSALCSHVCSQGHVIVDKYKPNDNVCH